MIEIILGNSYNQIKGITADQFKEIRKILSYETDPMIAYYTRGYSRTKYLIDKKGNYPAGLQYLLESFVKENKLKVKIVDTRIKPQSIPGMFNLDLNGLKPYKDQIHATNKAIKAHRGGIVMPTGSGKSLVIALIASRLNVRTLVVVPTLEIKKQLITQLNALFGIRLVKNIVVENIDSRSLQTLKDFSCLIIDECHHAAAKTYQKLNKTVWNNIYYRFFLTATFYRNQQNEQLLFEGIAGQVIHSLTIREAITEKYIVPVEAYYFEVPKQQTDSYTWTEVYSSLVVNNDERNKLISSLLIGLSTGSAAILCLVKEIAHGETLSRLTGIPFANGQDDIYRELISQFNSGQIKSLIGTTGILGEGVDTKPAEYVIIAGLGKAKSAFMQQIGRGVRNYPGKESCKIVLFKDKSHKFTLRHYNTQAKILKEELGIIPSKLEGL